MDAPSETNPKVLELTAQIVAAHVSHNPVSGEALPQLIENIYRTLTSLGQEKPPAPPEPAVPVKKSVHADYITCLECGKNFKMLRRHLESDHGLTPEAYRQKWGLPADYPLVAPNYAKKRSMLAKQIGLGTRHRSEEAHAEEQEEEPAKPRGRGRPRRR
jgi:predicted transcriptional regulator